jgi:hypothetical protein
MVSNLEDGLIHSAGLILVSMMIKFLFNILISLEILQLITVLVMKKLSISFKLDTMFQRDQLKLIMEKMSQELYIENPGISLVLELTNLNLVDGPTHSPGLMTAMMMTLSCEHHRLRHEAREKYFS